MMRIQVMMAPDTYIDGELEGSVDEDFAQSDDDYDDLVDA